MRSRIYIQLTGTSAYRLKEEARARHVSVARLVTALGQKHWVRLAQPTGSVPWLRVGARNLVLGLALSQRTLWDYERIARDLFVVSMHGAHDLPGIVLQAYFDGLVAPENLDVLPKPITHQPKTVVSLSRAARFGIKARFHSKRVGTPLNALAEQKATLFLSGQEEDFVFPRRQAVKLSLRHSTLEYLASWGIELGLEPQVRQGLISWASLCIEMLGHGLILVAPPIFTEQELPA